MISPGRCQWVGKFSGVLLWYIRTVVLTIKSTVSVVPLSFSIMRFPPEAGRLLGAPVCVTKPR